MKYVYIKEPQRERIFDAFAANAMRDEGDTFAGWLMRTYNIKHLTTTEIGIWVEGTERDLTMFLLKF